MSTQGKLALEQGHPTCSVAGCERPASHRRVPGPTYHCPDHLEQNRAWVAAITAGTARLEPLGGTT